MSSTLPQERYRSIVTTFWNDPKVSQYFTATDCLMFLYLITNLHNNLAGCYEVSINDIAHETKLKQEQITKSLKHLEKLDVIRTDPNTSEILIINYHKYNWSGTNPNVQKHINKISKHIKSNDFRKYILSLLSANGETIPYPYPIDSVCEPTVTDTDTETVTDTVTVYDMKQSKKKYGEYNHVLLSDSQLEKLKTELPDKWEQRIKAIDEYCEQTGKTYKNYYLAIKKWTDYPNTNSNTEERTYNTDNLKEMFKKW